MAPTVRSRMAVVSLHAHRPMAPRGERTRRLVGGLEGDGWEVSVVAPPPTVSTSGAAGSGSSNAARRLAARAVAWVLLDKWEPWAARRLLRWEPEIDAALLIAYPFSPVTYAARRLRARGIPYVVDAGDPWILTNPSPYSRGLARHRALRAERKLWEGAAGAVLTTPAQAERLGARFPGLPVLVRPNGYDPSPVSAPARSSRPGDASNRTLRHALDRAARSGSVVRLAAGLRALAARRLRSVRRRLRRPDRAAAAGGRRRSPRLRTVGAGVGDRPGLRSRPGRR